MTSQSIWYPIIQSRPGIRQATDIYRPPTDWLEKKLVFFSHVVLLHHLTADPTAVSMSNHTARHRRLPTMHAQRVVTSNVLIRQILAEIFGGIGGWHVVSRLGFGGVMVCVPRYNSSVKLGKMRSKESTMAMASSLLPTWGHTPGNKACNNQLT